MTEVTEGMEVMEATEIMVEASVVVAVAEVVAEMVAVMASVAAVVEAVVLEALEVVTVAVALLVVTVVEDSLEVMVLVHTSPEEVEVSLEVPPQAVAFLAVMVAQETFLEDMVVLVAVVAMVVPVAVAAMVEVVVVEALEGPVAGALGEAVVVGALEEALAGASVAATEAPVVVDSDLHLKVDSSPCGLQDEDHPSMCIEKVTTEPSVLGHPCNKNCGELLLRAACLQEVYPKEPLQKSPTSHKLLEECMHQCVSCGSLLCTILPLALINLPPLCFAKHAFFAV